MLYTALKEFSSSAHGNVSIGDKISVAPSLAPQWVEAGMIEPDDKGEYQTKPHTDAAATKPATDKPGRRGGKAKEPKA